MFWDHRGPTNYRLLAILIGILIIAAIVLSQLGCAPAPTQQIAQTTPTSQRVTVTIVTLTKGQSIQLNYIGPSPDGKGTWLTIINDGVLNPLDGLQLTLKSNTPRLNTFWISSWWNDVFGRGSEVIPSIFATRVESESVVVEYSNTYWK